MTDVQLVRVFKTTPDRLYAVVTREADILNWFGYDGMRFPDHQMDLTQRGPWHLTMHAANGTQYRLSGQVTRVDPPRSVSFTWGWIDDTGKRGAESHVTFSIEDAGDGQAQLTIDHRDLPTDEAAERHTQGWSMGAMPRLERYLAQPPE